MKKDKKTLLVVISKAIMRRNILDTDFWPRFTEANNDLRIVLVVEGGHVESYQKDFGGTHPDMVIVGTKKEESSWWDKLVLFLVRTGLNSHGVKLYRWRSRIMGEAGVGMTLIKSLIANTVGRFHVYHRFVRRLYGNLHLSWIEALFDEYQPDLVFTPTLIDINIDARIAATARRRGIRVVGMTRSWDNLVIHGLLPAVPDRFIFQNQWLADSARDYQGLNLEKLQHDIIGLPHYDLYHDPSAMIMDRDAFFKGMGLDPTKKLILLGGFDFYWSEDVVPRKLNEAITQGLIDDDVQVVFRPHPRTPFKMEDYHIDELEHVTLNAAFLNPNTAFSDTDTFVNLVYHCDVLINVASTLAVDAAVFDKPVICIDFDDPQKKIPYWKSVHRLFDSFDHYERLVATGGARLPKSFERLIDDINDYLKHPEKDNEGRQAIIDLLVAPFDGKAGTRLGAILSEEVKLLSS